ncbi:hypothetical protein CLOM_g19831 [Closterium sp. NIES-68]|nr:hypothetical protein CLOM_g19831 [Closterium sp. NIES-68]GJP67711.1 hypothetical protein CLOP_g24498 [Closterium sp. NIES-67]GJP85170.1 hypothetical protein CLOP_g15282 [Closterium sp. NIES-67]
MPPRRVKIKGLPSARPSPISPLARSASLTSASSPAVSAFVGVLGRYRRLLLVLILLLLSNVAGYYYPVLWSPARRATLLATRAKLSHWWANVSQPLQSLGKDADYELRRIIVSDEPRPDEQGLSRSDGRQHRGARFQPLDSPSPVTPGSLPNLSQGAEGLGSGGLGTWLTRAEDSQHVRDIPVTVYKKGKRTVPKEVAGGEASSGLDRPREGEKEQGGQGGQRGERVVGLETKGDGGRRGEDELREGQEGEVGGARADDVHVEQLDWQREYLEDVAIRVSKEKMCKGIFPKGLAKEEVEEKSSQPISRLSHLSRPSQRSLVFLARHGLGNSLRGFVSAFVFARLGGRQLVRLHAGEHHKVYDLLCHAFHCGFHAVRWGGLGGTGGAGEAGGGGGGGGNGTDEGGGEGEGMLLPMELYRRFNEMQPKYLLESIKRLPAMRDALASSHPIIGARTGSYFDLFWHRNDTLRDCVYAAFRCSSLWCVHSRAMYAFIGQRGPSKKLLATITSILHRSPPPLSSASLSSSILPAAANSANAGGADAAAGTGKVATTTEATSTSPSSSIPALPPFFLPPSKKAVAFFDIALHVRTRSLAIEKSVKRDTEEYLKGECEDWDRAAVVRPPYLRTCLWACIGHLVRELKPTLLQQRRQAEKRLRKEGSQEGEKGRGEAGGREGEQEGVGEEDEEGDDGDLNIFLATDDVEHRMEFVALLKPHGVVYFSAGDIYHTSKASPGSLDRGLPTMAEFFMMSKSRAIIEAGPYISTFAYFAALAGNGTLAGVSTQNGGCQLRPEHLAW